MTVLHDGSIEDTTRPDAKNLRRLANRPVQSVDSICERLMILDITR